MEEYQKEKGEQVEKIIEDIANEKYELIAEAKADFDFILKKLNPVKNKEKYDAVVKKKEEKIAQIVKDMEVKKKKLVEEIKG